MLTSETMALLGDGPIVDTNKNGKNVPELEKVSSVLLHCNVFKMIIYKIADCYSNNTFGKLLSIQPRELIQSKTTDSIFDYIEIWFTDQDNSPLQIEDKVNVFLIIQSGLWIGK